MRLTKTKNVTSSYFDEVSTNINRLIKSRINN